MPHSAEAKWTPRTHTELGITRRTVCISTKFNRHTRPSPTTTSITRFCGTTTEERWQNPPRYTNTSGAGELPVEVDKRKLTKVALRHLSWAEVIHEARVTLSHGGIDNPLQAWILHEFLRYIEHPKSRASEFVDMGRHWVSIRDAISAGTLRSGDPKASSIADSWIALARKPRTTVHRRARGQRQTRTTAPRRQRR